MDIWVNACITSCRHTAIYFYGIVVHSKVRINPVISILDLRMSIVKILTSSGWVVS